MATLFREQLTAGEHEFQWDGRNSSGREAVSGIYQLRALGKRATALEKIVLLR